MPLSGLQPKAPSGAFFCASPLAVMICLQPPPLHKIVHNLPDETYTFILHIPYRGTVLAMPDLTPKVNQALNAALTDADVKERFARLGAEPTGGTPAAFASRVKAGNAKWKKIITDRKITAE